MGTITSSGESAAAEGGISTPPSSGASTPPTSASDSENAAKQNELDESANMAKKNNKRKRGEEDGVVANKKLKQEQADARIRVEEVDAVPLMTKTPLGIFDADQITTLNTFVDSTGVQALNIVKKNAKKGAYGLHLPTSAEKGRKKGEPHPLFDDPHTGKKVTYKAAKVEREKTMRDAKRDIVKELVAVAMTKGYFPNPERWTKDQALANYGKISRTIEDIEKAAKRIRKSVKEQQKQDKRDAAAEQKRLKQERRQTEKQAKAEAELAKQREAISSKLNKLTPDDRAEYEKRAAEKNQTLEEYVQRRIAKKEAKRTAKTAQEAAEKAAHDATNALFVVDLEGDANLATDLIPPTYTPLPDGTCPLDPTIWASRTVKTLPKPVREARRKYLEQQRNERKLRAGKSIEKGLTRADWKRNNVAMLTREVLHREGIKKDATKEEKNKARRLARKFMKAQKKELKGKGKTRGGRNDKKAKMGRGAHVAAAA